MGGAVTAAVRAAFGPEVAAAAGWALWCASAAWGVFSQAAAVAWVARAFRTRGE